MVIPIINVCLHAYTDSNSAELIKQTTRCAWLAALPPPRDASSVAGHQSSAVTCYRERQHILVFARRHGNLAATCEMLFLLPTALLSFASQPGGGEGPSSSPPPGPPAPLCSVIQDTCDGCTETGPGDGFISFLNLGQFHSKWATIQNTRTRDRTAPRPRAAYLLICLGRGLLCVRSHKTPIPNPTHAGTRMATLTS